MFFRKKYSETEKISFNCPKKLVEEIDEIADFEFCSRTEIMKQALEEYYKKFKRKIRRLEKKWKVKRGSTTPSFLLNNYFI